MGHRYTAVQWNGNKIVYDAIAIAGLILFLGIFLFVGLQPHPSGHTADPVVLMIKALGSASFVLLTLVLLIGPLARLSPRFLPFLYNRRHLGVLTFLVAGAHFGLALVWYHGGGPLNPFVSLLTSGLPGDPFPGVPFELFGLAAFAILLVMAVTSHDFWLNNLSAPVWKTLHMGVYVAYGSVLLHVAYGALATSRASLDSALALGSFLLVGLVHLSTGWREWRRDSAMKAANAVAVDGDNIDPAPIPKKNARARRAKGSWMDVASPADIPDQRAVIAPLPKGDRVAIFRDGARIFAVQNACRHQNGPLGEGCLKDGLVTCPWHGWQYRPEDGISPPPFTEKIATYDVRLSAGRVEVKTRPNKPGTKGQAVMLDMVSPS